jgi:2-amino-4-hydroxy-6-hydroxymethyldihydropteridine diphosphokinase
MLEGEGHLQIPRAELQHAFVLRPLAEIAPDAVVPGKGHTLAELWDLHPDRNAVMEQVAL